MMNSSALTPKQIVAELDKYIVGQDDAKRNVAIALRDRWRRMNVQSEIQEDIIPNNILMIGATGVGKTEIARRLAKIADAPFVKVEASKFTEVGYVGRDVESMVRDLVEQSVNMVKARKKEEVKGKAAAIVEEIIDAKSMAKWGVKTPGVMLLCEECGNVFVEPGDYDWEDVEYGDDGIEIKHEVQPIIGEDGVEIPVKPIKWIYKDFNVEYEGNDGPEFIKVKRKGKKKIIIKEIKVHNTNFT